MHTLYIILWIHISAMRHGNNNFFLNDVLMLARVCALTRSSTACLSATLWVFVYLFYCFPGFLSCAHSASLKIHILYNIIIKILFIICLSTTKKLFFFAHSTNSYSVKDLSLIFVSLSHLTLSLLLFHTLAFQLNEFICSHQINYAIFHSKHW